MPVGVQPVDPRILAALPRVRAVMKQRGHAQKDVVLLSKQSQSQVSKFLAGRRHRVTDAVIKICQYAGIDVDSESTPQTHLVPLSQSVRRVLEDNPNAAALVARVIDALMPVLLNIQDSATNAPKEAP